MSEKEDPNKDYTFLLFITPEMEEEYYSTYGKFVHACAVAENNLKLFMLSFLQQRILDANFNKTNHEAAKKSIETRLLLKTLLANMANSEAIDTMQRLVRVLNFSEEVNKDVRNTFEHWRKIIEFRNKIIHYGASFHTENKDGWFYININSESEPHKEGMVFFKLLTLRNMTSDLHAISARLRIAINPEKFPKPVQPRPWLYKDEDFTQIEGRGPKFAKKKRSNLSLGMTAE